jgi:hypothetical protein
MKLRLALLIPLALLTLSGNLIAENAVDYGTDGPDTQMDLGSPDPDFILQYGRGGNDTQYISGADNDDWIEQYGGTGNDNNRLIP